MAKIKANKYLANSRTKLRKYAACKCGCGFHAVDVELDFVVTKILNKVMGYYDKPAEDVYIYILSWNRCQYHNKKVKGAPGSAHVKGTALDFVVSYRSNNREELVDYDVMLNIIMGIIKEAGINIEIGLYDKGRFHIAVSETGIFDKRSEQWR